MHIRRLKRPDAAKPYPIIWKGYLRKSDRPPSGQFDPKQDMAVFFVETPYRIIAITLFPDGIQGLFWEPYGGTIESLSKTIVETLRGAYIGNGEKVINCDDSLKRNCPMWGATITWQHAGNYIDKLVDAEMGTDQRFEEWQAGHMDRRQIFSENDWPGWERDYVPLKVSLVTGDLQTLPNLGAMEAALGKALEGVVVH